MKIKFVLITICLLSLLASCSKIHIMGYYYDKDLDIDVQQYVGYSKRDILAEFGTPNLVSNLSPETWYYISVSLDKNLLGVKEVVDQNVMSFQFKEQNVELASWYGKEDINEVIVSSSKTPDLYKKSSIFKKLIAGVGVVSPL